MRDDVSEEMRSHNSVFLMGLKQLVLGMFIILRSWVRERVMLTVRTISIRVKRADFSGLALATQ